MKEMRKYKPSYFIIPSRSVSTELKSSSTCLSVNFSPKEVNTFFLKLDNEKKKMK